MYKQTNKVRFFHLGALIGIVALGSIGCGQDELEPTDSTQSALTSNLGPYGSVTGTPSGAGTVGHATTITKIICYGSTDNVYGLKVYWGTVSKLFGQTNGSAAWNFNVAGDPIYKIEQSTSSGNLRGLRFTNSTASLTCGNMSGGATVLNNLDAEFTDLEVWTGDVNMVPVIWGIKLYYTTP